MKSLRILIKLLVSCGFELENGLACEELYTFHFFHRFYQWEVQKLKNSLN
jgi:hypothetical protein